MRPKHGRCALEPESDTDGRSDRALVQETAGEAVLHPGPHESSVGVEALGEAIIERCRDRILGTAAGRGLVARAAGVGADAVAVLSIAVIRPRQVELRGNRGL